MERKQADVNSAAKEGERLLEDEELTPDDVRERLEPIQRKYRTNRLDLVTESKTEDSEIDYVHAEINPDAQSKKVKKQTKVNIKLERPGGFRYSTRKELKARYPHLHQKTTGNKTLVLPSEARRHIIPSQEVLENIQSTLNGKTFLQAKKILDVKRNALNDKKDILVTSLTNAGIERAAKALFRHFFNDVENLWVGNSRENSALGDVRDFPEDWPPEKVDAHIAEIERKYLLP